MTIGLTRSPLSRYRLGNFETMNHAPLMAMVEITNRCNMTCPVCFSAARNTSSDVSLEEIKLRLKNLLQVAGPIPLQISGGEPTLHRELPQVIHYAKKVGFKNIELITNGIRISQEPSYLFSLVDHGLTAVYLQFDGLTKATYMQIRGRDMSEVRSRSLTAIRDAEICCTLAVAVIRDINDNELGDIVRFAINNIDTVRAINFQSAARFTGRFEVDSIDPGYHLPELIQRIEKLSRISPGGFATDILGHSQCNAMSLLYLIDGKLEPLFKHISPKTLSHFLGNNSREIIADLFRGKEKFARKHITNPKAWRALLEASSIFGKSKKLSSILKAQHILLFAKSFMEKDSLDENRIALCNYAIAETDGVYSFCAFNNLHRFAKGNRK